MKNPIIVIVLAVIFIQLNTLKGQNSYYITEKSKVSGVTIISGTEQQNAHILKVSIGNRVFEYTPDTIVEYGKYDGRLYQSKEVRINGANKMVFLERISNGIINFYYLSDNGKARFFIEHEHKKLIEISKSPENKNYYKDILREEFKANKNTLKQLQFVRYKKRDFSAIGDRFNYNIKGSFPRMKYGAFAGAKILNFTPSNKVSYPYLDNTIIETQIAGTYGIYTEIPSIFKDFSYWLELNFNKSFMSEKYKALNDFTEFKCELLTIEIPLLLKYNLPFDNFRPHIELGSNFSYNLQNEASISTGYRTGSDAILLSENNRTFIGNKLFGYIIGAGLDVEITDKIGLFTMLRYSSSYSIPSTENLNTNSYSFILGVNF
ncbi:MAG: outer membrane beta-barrel protein [Salinivirgaceae bacterium]|nr:outer membrane beta-barrel protein [Salinivirgaceae bacterium]